MLEKKQCSKIATNLSDFLKEICMECYHYFLTIEDNEWRLSLLNFLKLLFQILHFLISTVHDQKAYL